MNSNCPQPVENLSVENSDSFCGKNYHPGSQKIIIDQYEFCYDDNSLLFENCRQSVQPKVMKLVKLLVEEQGRIVTREKIEATLWPKAIVGLDSVNNTIARLRRLLNDNPRDPRFIETIPRIGYRLKIQSSPKDPILSKIRTKLAHGSKLKLVSSIVFLTSVIGILSLNYKLVPQEEMTLHRSPEHQKMLLAENMTVNELVEQYDIILKSKKNK